MRKIRKTSNIMVLNKGTVVDSLESNSPDNAPSIRAVNEVFDSLKNVILFENNSGASDNITLSESSANFNYLEIYFKSADNIFSYTKVANPHGKSVYLTTMDLRPDADQFSIFRFKLINISGTAINNQTYAGAVKGGYAAFRKTQNETATAGNDQILITKVVGIK